MEMIISTIISAHYHFDLMLQGKAGEFLTQLDLIGPQVRA